MLAVIRQKFGPIFIGVLIGFISFVFIFWGVWSRDSMVQGNNAGSVNGEPVSLSDFNRELSRRLEMYKGLNLNEEQLKQFRIKESVFDDLVERRLMVQKAESMGIKPSDAEVRESVLNIPAFQTDGKFDKAKYEQLLAANKYTPASFEDMIRKDIQIAFWGRYFKSFVKISDAEVTDEFRETMDRRRIKYVYLTLSSAYKGVTVEPAKVDEFLKNADREKQAKTRYDLAKDSKYKGKKYDEVKREIARDIVATENPEPAKKFNEALVARILPLMDGSAASDKKVNDVLKGVDVTVRDSGWLNRRSQYLPGVGEAETLFKEAFGGDLSKPKRYELPGGILVAQVVEAEKADLGKLNTEEKGKLRDQMAYRKENDLHEQWMKVLRETAKVTRNNQVFN